MAEGIGEIVEAVPMPADIQAKIAEFFAAFHKERPFIKRKRDRADPEALARRKPGLSDRTINERGAEFPFALVAPEARS